MRKLPNIFKPEFDHDLNNNKDVYYSSSEKNTNNSRNNIYNSFNDNVLIKTKRGDYRTKIASRMGNSIIIANGKIISITDIISIEKI